MMDQKIEELIAIGAALGAHCQPCFTYHMGKARELGVTDDEIKAAVAIGESVQRGAAAAIHKHVRESMGSTIPESSCCQPPEPKTCCNR